MSLLRHGRLHGFKFAGVNSTPGWKVRSPAIANADRVFIAGLKKHLGVEGQVARDRERGHKLGRGHERVRGRVAVVASGKVAVVRRDDAVRLACAAEGLGSQGLHVLRVKGVGRTSRRSPRGHRAGKLSDAVAQKIPRKQRLQHACSALPLRRLRSHAGERSMIRVGMCSQQCESQ